jgi:hypothetical protein
MRSGECDECGYDYDELDRDEIPARIRGFGPRYADLLVADEVDLRTHIDKDVWSPLEYACHIRDVFNTQRERLEQALAEDEPEFAPMRREERVEEEHYNEQDPSRVANEVADAADALASAFEALDDDGWARTGVYGYPTKEVRTLEWIGRHTIHEGEHHVLDIERLLP